MWLVVGGRQRCLTMNRVRGNSDVSDRFFTKAAKGGAIASRIDAQDLVAAVLALDAMRGALPPLHPPEGQDAIEFFPEGLEDLEIRQRGSTLLVSVKDQSMDEKMLIAEIAEKLGRQNQSSRGDRVSLRVCVLGGLQGKARSLWEDIQHLRTRGQSRFKDPEPGKEFERRWGISPSLAAHVWIDPRGLGVANPGRHAIFANALRLTFPTTTVGDRAILDLEGFVTNEVFSPARRSRDMVDLLPLEGQLASLMAPQEILLWTAAYYETSFGYLKNSAADQGEDSDLRILRSAVHHVKRDWIRKTRWERLLLPRVNCLVCEHPMMANLNSLHGCACPDCGFMPFGTLLYACDCGEPITIADNPPVKGPETFTLALTRVRDNQPACRVCDRPVDPRKLATRIFFAPMPYPVPDSVDSILIARRMAMGKPKKVYSPDEAREWLMSDHQEGWDQHLPAARARVAHDFKVSGTLKVLVLLGLIAFVMFRLA